MMEKNFSKLIRKNGSVAIEPIMEVQHSSGG